VLTGMLLISAGGVYVVSSLPVGARGGGRSIAGASGPAPAPSGSAAEGARSRGGSSPIAGGGVPAWTGLDRRSVPTEPFAPVPQGRYAVNPDFGHAELGSSSAPSGGGTSGSAAIADAGSPGGGDGPTGGAPGAGPAPSTPDLSGTSSGRAAGGDAPEWRSEAQALASRSRALSQEVTRLNREEASSEKAQGERAEQPSGEASTASGRGGAETNNPGTPDNPDQVPLGGAEWLAAAGAAYALNRLREEDGDEEESEDDA
jgi:hypothetical protein